MQSNGKDEIQKFSGHDLVADGDAQIRNLLGRRADKKGLSVLEVENGNEAMEALEEEWFNLIISDLYMPGDTGLEEIPKAQEKDPEIRSIIVTSSATVERSIGWAMV